MSCVILLYDFPIFVGFVLFLLLFFIFVVLLFICPFLLVVSWSGTGGFVFCLLHFFCVVFASASCYWFLLCGSVWCLVSLSVVSVFVCFCQRVCMMLFNYIIYYFFRNDHCKEHAPIVMYTSLLFYVF